jgi:hypothetical protein
MVHPVAETKIRLSTVVPDALPTYYVHGAGGGLGPLGEIVMYLYEDSVGVPREHELTVDTDSGAIVADMPLDEPRMRRTVLAKLVLPPSVAAGIAAWIQAQVAVQRGPANGGGRPL